MPIELLDVAGLVPGAHEGKGLGNKFLDDLRHADALIHVVVSGTTDAEGKVTRGYDPSVDIAWLRSEIVAWIRGNLMTKWGSIKRRHIAVKATAVETLQNQFSGYGSTAQVVARTLDKLALKEPLEDWSGMDSSSFKIVSTYILTHPKDDGVWVLHLGDLGDVLVGVGVVDFVEGDDGGEFFVGEGLDHAVYCLVFGMG